MPPFRVNYEHSKALSEYLRLKQVHAKVLSGIRVIPMVHKLGLTRIEPATAKTPAPTCSMDACLKIGRSLFVVINNGSMRVPVSVKKTDAAENNLYLVSSIDVGRILELKDHSPVLLGREDLSLTKEGVALTSIGGDTVRVENFSGNNAYVGFGLTAEPTMTEKETSQNLSASVEALFEIVPPEQTIVKNINREYADGHYDWFRHGIFGPLKAKDRQDMEQIFRFPVRVTTKGRILGLGDVPPQNEDEDFFIAHFGFKARVDGNMFILDPKIGHYVIGSAMDGIYPSYELLTNKVADLLTRTAMLYNMAANQGKS